MLSNGGEGETVLKLFLFSFISNVRTERTWLKINTGVQSMSCDQLPSTSNFFFRSRATPRWQRRPTLIAHEEQDFF